MSSTQGDPSGAARPRQDRASVQLLAAILGVLPLYSGLMVYQLRRGEPPSLQGFLFYLAVASPLAIVIVLVLLRTLCREDPRDLNLVRGTFASDSLAVVILVPLIILANIVSNGLLPELLPNTGPGTSIRPGLLEVARDPGLFVLFLGPLVFMGSASEELVRVFLLSRLWKAFPSTLGKLVAVAISAGWFGIIHMYRGPIHVLWTAILGVLLALYYLRFGRVIPLILAHYLTNAIQVAVVVGVLGR
jgi:membrane protease YdiL (CAAX protease family)